jgi:hypothetical protein
MPWTVPECLLKWFSAEHLWQDLFMDMVGDLISQFYLELWFSFTPSQLLGNILFNSLQRVGLHFFPKFWQLEKWLIVNIKIWFLKFGSYAVCDCSCIWVWVKSKRYSKVHVFIRNSFVDLVKDLSMTWASFVGLAHMKRKPWAYRWS